MNDYDFIRYQETPEDAYTKALITIRQNLFKKDGTPSPQLLTFGTKDLKTGGQFHAMSNHGVTIDGVKKYVKGHRCDSSGEQEMIEAFIAEIAKHRGDPKTPSAFKSPAPRSMDEVADAHGLQF